jgi:hypothetical protein
VIVSIAADRSLELIDHLDLGRFHVEATAGIDVHAALMAADAGWMGREDAFVTVAWLCQEVQRLDPPAGWGAELEAMRVMAAEHGWTNARGDAVRAHVTRR